MCVCVCDVHLDSLQGRNYIDTFGDQAQGMARSLDLHVHVCGGQKLRLIFTPFRRDFVWAPVDHGHNLFSACLINKPHICGFFIKHECFLQMFTKY